MTASQPDCPVVSVVSVVSVDPDRSEVRAVLVRSIALLWGMLVDGYRPLPNDLVGVSFCLLGVGIIVVGARGA